MANERTSSRGKMIQSPRNSVSQTACEETARCRRARNRANHSGAEGPAYHTKQEKAAGDTALFLGRYEEPFGLSILTTRHGTPRPAVPVLPPSVCLCPLSADGRVPTCAQRGLLLAGAPSSLASPRGWLCPVYPPRRKATIPCEMRRPTPASTTGRGRLMHGNMLRDTAITDVWLSSSRANRIHRLA